MKKIETFQSCLALIACLENFQQFVDRFGVTEMDLKSSQSFIAWIGWLKSFKIFPSWFDLRNNLNYFKKIEFFSKWFNLKNSLKEIEVS